MPLAHGLARASASRRNGVLFATARAKAYAHHYFSPPHTTIKHNTCRSPPRPMKMMFIAVFDNVPHFVRFSFSHDDIGFLSFRLFIIDMRYVDAIFSAAPARGATRRSEVYTRRRRRASGPSSLAMSGRISRWSTTTAKSARRSEEARQASHRLPSAASSQNVPHRQKRRRRRVILIARRRMLLSARRARRQRCTPHARQAPRGMTKDMPPVSVE